MTLKRRTPSYHCRLYPTNRLTNVEVIDGIYIPISGPRKHRAVYINLKGFLWIRLQDVCDVDLQFLAIYCWWAGPVHDARVFKYNPLSNVHGYLPQEYHLLSDSTYALAPYMMVIYRDNGNLHYFQTAFSTQHASTIIAFGLLKCKFRRLNYLDMRLVAKTPFIAATWELHDFILLKIFELLKLWTWKPGPKSICYVTRQHRQPKQNGISLHLSVLDCFSTPELSIGTGIIEILSHHQHDMNFIR